MRDEPDAAVPPGTRCSEEAVRRELTRSHRQLQTFLRRRLGDPHEADEVLQGFAVKALSRSWSLRDVRSVRGWLGRVLASTLVDHQRRAGVRRRRHVPEAAAAFQKEAEPDAAVDGAVCDCLHGLLATLKPQYAEVLRRIDITGEPRDRVAAELATSTNNLTVRLHRARRALQGRLEAMCLTCPEHGYFNCRCEDERRRADIRGSAARGA